MEFLLLLKQEPTKEQWDKLENADLEYEIEDEGLCFTSRSELEIANKILKDE